MSRSILQDKLNIQKISPQKGIPRVGFFYYLIEQLLPLERRIVLSIWKLHTLSPYVTLLSVPGHSDITANEARSNFV